MREAFVSGFLAKDKFSCVVHCTDMGVGNATRFTLSSFQKTSFCADHLPDLHGCGDACRVSPRRPVFAWGIVQTLVRNMHEAFCSAFLEKHHFVGHCPDVSGGKRVKCSFVLLGKTPFLAPRIGQTLVWKGWKTYRAFAFTHVWTMCEAKKTFWGMKNQGNGPRISRLHV